MHVNIVCKLENLEHFDEWTNRKGNVILIFVAHTLHEETIVGYPN